MRLGEEDILTVMQTLGASLLEATILPAEDLALTPQAPRCRVPVAGSFQGSVAVSCSLALARRLAARMFGVGEGAVSAADVEDAVFELGNMVAGNLRTLMPLPTEIGLPGPYGQDPAEMLCQRLSFACDGEPLVVSLFQSQAA